MARLNREESQAQTRARLLAVARTLFARDGYAATSLDRIAEEAGFSKGAVYSNFTGKEQLFLEVLEEHGQTSLAEVLSEIDDAQDIGQVIDRVASWATRNSRKGNWPMLILEYARHAKPASTFRRTQETVLLSHWKTLGERLLAFSPDPTLPPETVGALVFELTYAPAMSFVRAPTSGDLLRAALSGLLGSRPGASQEHPDVLKKKKRHA